MPPTSRKRHVVQEEEDSSEDERTQSTQRKRRRTPVSDEEEDEEEEEDLDQEMGEDGEANPHDQAVKKLVRYALACEYQRISIKRTGITEKVIGTQRRSFKPIFEAAQHQLRTKFGMEMVELPVKEKVTLKEKRAAQKTKGTSKPTASYILTTVLPPKFRTPAIMPPSNIGSVADEAAYMGLYTLICTLVTLSPEGQMKEHKLAQLMARLNIDRNTGLGTKDALLKRMKADGYLHEVKTGTPDDAQTEYRVGPRGKIEVGNHSIIPFVKEVYEYSGAAPDDLEKKLQKSLGMDMTRFPEENGVKTREVEPEVDNGDPGPSTRRAGRRTRAAADDD